MEENNGNNGMEKLLEGEIKVDDPRPMRKMRKERPVRARVQGLLGLMRGHLMPMLFIEIWEAAGAEGDWIGGFGDDIHYR